MIEIRMHDPHLNVGTRDDGIRVVSLRDEESGITVRVFLPDEAAHKVAQALTGGVVLAPASALGIREVQH